jgi:hypothetical protein
MTIELLGLAKMLVAVYGRVLGVEIFLVAFRSLPLAERAAFGLILEAEEASEVERVAEAIRKEIARSLPATLRRLSDRGRSQFAQRFARGLVTAPKK